MKIAKLLDKICNSKNEFNKSEIDYLIIESKGFEKRELKKIKSIVLNNKEAIAMMKDDTLLQIINSKKLLRFIAIYLCVNDDR